MFDVSFTELLVIGVVALVVIGPERLPKVARTLGLLVGRAQRYVNDVKTDIQREVELDELRNLKNQMQDAAQSVQSSLQNTESELRKPLEALEQDVSSLKDSFTHASSDLVEPVAPELPKAAVAVPTQLELGAVASAPTPELVPLTVPAQAPNQTSVASTTPGSAS